MLELAGVSVRYGTAVAVDVVDLRVDDGEIVAVLGPSGSGKSTLLRAAAGLEPLTAGSVRWDRVDLGPVPTHRRGFGLMFQDHALFPHRDVLGNVAFGLRMHRLPRDEIDTRARASLALVGLTGFETRRINDLSGGEQQRVALARALAPEPRLLMLDEPLGALDRALREHLVAELRTLFVRIGITVVFVTHDHDEAFAIADRIVVMHEGRVAQDGAPSDVWQHPADAFVARFLGWNVTDAFGVAGAVRPEHLTLAEHGVAGTVVERTFRRDHWLVSIRTDDDDEPLRVAVTLDHQPPDVGTRVHVTTRDGTDVMIV